MKKLKGILSLLMALMMLGGLAACAQNHGTASGDNQAWKGVWDFSTKSAISDAGYYYSVNGSIWFADLQSGTAVPLCTKAGCDHDGDSSCEVYIWGNSPIFFSGDSLYSIESGNYGTTLYRRDATGAALMKVTDLGTKYTENEKVLSVKYFGCAGDYLYYCADVSGLVRDEETGMQTSVDEIQYISRVDLKTGKETFIIEDEVGAFYDDIQIVAVREDGVLFTHLNASDVRKDDTNYLDILDADPKLLKCWVSGMGEVRTLLETNFGTLLDPIGVYGGKFYYSSKHKFEDGTKTYAARVFDLDTGEDKMLFVGRAVSLGGGYLLCTDTQTLTKTVYHVDTEQTLPYALTEGNAQINITSEKGAVISILMNTTPRESRYYFVPKEAMADGLQEEDLLYLYTKKYSK